MLGRRGYDEGYDAGVNDGFDDGYYIGTAEGLSEAATELRRMASMYSDSPCPTAVTLDVVISDLEHRADALEGLADLKARQAPSSA